jgi:branched-chain amino acid transport system ATP-binding protein
MITGNYTPTSGRIYYRGMDITGFKPDRITKLGVAGPSRIFGCSRI